MALSGSGLSNEIESALAGIGWDGTSLTDFSSAIGNGIVNATSGILEFTTSDVGLVPGTGTGTGTGVTGMSDSSMSSDIFSTGQDFWSSLQNDGPGEEWQKFSDKISETVVNHFSTNATLTSTHSPVYSGTGTVVSYSGVAISDMTSAIIAQAPAAWTSARFPELAEAVATGVVNSLLNHSPADTVDITGSPSGTSSSGTGSGSGVVT